MGFKRTKEKNTKRLLVLGKEDSNGFNVVDSRDYSNGNKVDAPNIPASSEYRINNAYDIGIQDLLTPYFCKKIEYTPLQIEAMKRYKAVNELYCQLRSECFEDIIGMYTSRKNLNINDGRGSIEQFARELVAIEELFSLSKLKHNIVVYRGGGRKVEEGEKKQYNSLVSTSLRLGLAERFANGTNPNIYRMILRKDTPIIPIELVPIDHYVHEVSENEILLPPLSFTVQKKEQRRSESNVKSYEFVTADNMEFFSLLQCFKEKVDLFAEYVALKRNEIDFNTQIGQESQELLQRMQLFGYNRDEVSKENQIGISDAVQLLMDNGNFDIFLQKYYAIDGDKTQYDSVTHGKEHTKRVLFNAMIIAQLENLSEQDTNILMYAAQYHDIGREHDMEDAEHGQKSAKKLEKDRILNMRSELTDEDKSLIEFVITEHSKTKKENEIAIQQLTEEQKKRYKKLLDCFKDADKLDRVRLGRRRVRC